jgi:thiol-disulfide isomerase/thioredoxin
MAEVSTASNTDTQDVAAMQSQAPDFTMQDASGKTVKLSDLKGTPVVLNFWTSWCSYCKEEMPYFESAYKQYGDKVKFVMLNVTRSERNSDDGKNFVKDSGYTFPAFYETEGKAMTLYGLRGFPATMFIDANGNIVKKNIGAISEGDLNNNIKALLGQ